MEFKNELRDTVLKIAESNLADPAFFIVEIQVKGSSDQPKIIVLVDGDNGVKIDDCARLSRKIGSELELKSDLNFSLEVSSPGLDHPLVSIRQYRKNVGRLVKCELEGGKVIKGRLEKVTDDTVSLKMEQGKSKKKKKGKKKEDTPAEMELPLTDIVKTKVLIEF